MSLKKKKLKTVKKPNRKITKHYFTSGNKKEFFYLVKLDKKQALEFCKKKGGLKLVKMKFFFMCIDKKYLKTHESHISIIMHFDKLFGIIADILTPKK